MKWQIFVILFTWLIFFSLWIVGKYVYKSQRQKERNKNWFSFLFYVALITILAELLASKYLLNRLDFPEPFDFLSEITGTVLLISGLFFAVWARVTLGSFWSGSVALIQNQPIIREGPYSIVRHPIYAGIIAMLWGSFLLERVGFVFLKAVLATLFLLWKAKLEESMLETQTIEYRDYKGG